MNDEYLQKDPVNVKSNLCKSLPYVELVEVLKDHKSALEEAFDVVRSFSTNEGLVNILNGK